MLIEPRMRIGREQKQVIEAETQAISILSQVCTAHLRMHSCTMRAAYNISLNIAAVYFTGAECCPPPCAADRHASGAGRADD